MINREADVAALIRELSVCAPEARKARLCELAASADAVTRLCDELDNFAMADLSAAMTLGETLVDCAVAMDDQHAVGRVRRTWAQMLAYANRFEESLEQVRQAVEAARAAGQAAEEARALLTSLHALARLGRFDQAIENGEAARAAFTRLNETRLKARASANLGVIHRMRDDPARALDCFAEALELLTDEPMATAQLQSNRAEALLDLHQFEAAEQAFIDARGQFELIGAKRAAAIVEGNIADLMSRQGRLEEALRHFERAIHALQGPEVAAPGDIARLRAEAAEAYTAAGAWEEALQLYEQALGPLGKHGMAWETARALSGLGTALARSGRHEAAERRLREATKRLADLGHQTAGARVGIALGDLAMRLGKANAARELFVDALEKLAARPIDACLARHRLAQLALSIQNLPAAESLLEEATRALDGRHHTPTLAELWRTRALLRRAQGRRREAIDDLRRAVDHIERVRGVLPPGRLRASFIGTRSDAYSDLLLLLLEQEDEQVNREAFRVAEQARCRTLLDLMSGAIAMPRRGESGATRAASESSAGGLAAFDEVARLRRELNALYSKVDLLSWREQASAGDTAAAPSEMDTFERIERLERELGLAESRLAVQGDAGGMFAEPSDVDQIIAAMPADTALVEFFSTGEGIGAFVIRDGRLSVHRCLVDRAALAEHQKRFEFQLNRSLVRFAAAERNLQGRWPRDGTAQGTATAPNLSSSDIDEELASLYDMLMQPIVPLVEGAGRLLVVPVGALHAIPFAALRNRQTGRYLIEDFEIGILPSASLLGYLNPIDAISMNGQGTDEDGQPRAARSTPLIVGVADEHAPSIEREVASLQQVLPDADVLVAEAATADRILASMRGRSLVHLACHGRFMPWQPMGSGLRLADRWLTVRELFDLDLRGATVMLSACETGRSRIESGEESIGLMRGFFAAGAGRILISLWPLNDTYAQKMVAAAYDIWTRETGPFAAVLATVQRRMIEEEVHPALWAPVTMIGKE